MNLLLEPTGIVWSFPFEHPFILWFQSLGGEGSFLYYLNNFFSIFGEEYFIALLLGLIYWGFSKSIGEKITFTVIAGNVINTLIKNIFCRSRPFNSVEEIQNFRDVDGYSFPSGHSSGSSSLLGSTAWNYREKKFKWLWIIAIALPIFVAISRVYLGAHYPTDVIGGLLLGVLTILLFEFLYNVVPNKYYIYIGMLVVGFCGFFYCDTSDYYTSYGMLFGFVFGVIFEEKITKFSNTKSWWRITLRALVGGALFIGLNYLLKLPFTSLLNEEHLWFERTYRVLRYALITFILWGVYPLTFAQAEKLWIKFGWIKPKQSDFEGIETTQE